MYKENIVEFPFSVHTTVYGVARIVRARTLCSCTIAARPGGRLYLHCCSTVALHIVVVHRVCVQRAGGGASDSPPFFGWFPSSRADAVVGVICHGGAALGGESLRRRRRVNVRGGGGKGLVAAAKEEEGSLSPFSPFPRMIGIHTPPGKRGRKM